MALHRKRRMKNALRRIKWARQELDREIARLQDIVDGKPCPHDIYTSTGRHDGGGWIHFGPDVPSFCDYCGEPQPVSAEPRST